MVIKTQAEPITMNDKKMLWENGMPGDGSPHISVPETMIFMCGIYSSI